MEKADYSVNITVMGVNFGLAKGGWDEVDDQCLYFYEVEPSDEAIKLLKLDSFTQPHPFDLQFELNQGICELLGNEGQDVIKSWKFKLSV